MKEMFLNLILCAFVAATVLASPIEETIVRREDCTCLPLEKCPPFLKLIEERKFDEMREQIRCGFEEREPLLCCPTDNTEEGAKIDTITRNLAEGIADNMTEVNPVHLENLASVMDKNSSEPFNGFNERYQDCSHIFENRVLHFEYRYYPSYWLYPFKFQPTQSKRLAIYWATPDDAKSYALDDEMILKSYAKWIARPHHSKQGLALMSMAPGWETYYAGRWNGWKSFRAWIAGASYESHPRDLDDATQMWKIYCTNECRPADEEKDVYDECILSQGGYWHYHEQNGYSTFGPSPLNEDWLRYRIYAPQTNTYYEEVYYVDNCNMNNDPLAATYTAKSSVTITNTNSRTVTKDQTTTWTTPFKETMLPIDVINVCSSFF